MGIRGAYEGQIMRNIGQRKADVCDVAQGIVLQLKDIYSNIMSSLASFCLSHPTTSAKLQPAQDGDAREFYRRRVVEIKHGRVSMLACTGTQAADHQRDMMT